MHGFLERLAESGSLGSKTEGLEKRWVVARIGREEIPQPYPCTHSLEPRNAHINKSSLPAQSGLHGSLAIIS